MWAATASADPPSDADKDRARELYRQGNDAYAAQHYDDAREAFEAADAIMHVPTTGLGLAKSQRQTGRLLAAYATLERVVRSPEAPLEPESFTLARNEARQLLPLVLGQIPTVTVQIAGASVGTITIDGRLSTVPATPQGDQPVRLDPGRHALSVSARGFLTAHADVTLREGESRVVSVVLVEEAGAPASTNTPALAAMITGFGLGFVGVVVGAVTGALSLSDTASLNDTCGTAPCPEAVRAEHDEAIALANASNVSLAVGGVGIIVGIIGLVLFVSDDEPAATQPVTLTRNGLQVRF